MPELSRFILFLVAAFVLLVVPGPAVLYIVARSMDQGRRAGFMSVLGVATGSMIHVTAAALGLSALLASSAAAFNSVKYLGAAYLIFLGIRKFFGKDEATESAAAPPMHSSRRIFTQGVLVNTLNPKTALFFFAFLPQFVSVSRGSVAVQIITLGLIFSLMGICTDGLWALLAGTVGAQLKRNLRFLKTQRYVSGTVCIGLGLATAMSGSRRSS
jgi:threonine/homoserine/homoserine lactone efflux protein